MALLEKIAKDLTLLFVPHTDIYCMDILHYSLGKWKKLNVFVTNVFERAITNNVSDMPRMAT